MTTNQLKSRAMLVIAALVTGTIISTGAHLLLTSRNTGGESSSQSKAADTEAENSADSLAEQEMSKAGADGDVAGDSGNATDGSEGAEVATGESPNKTTEDAADADDSSVVAYEKKVESLFAKLDELKSKRQALRDRIQFDSAEF